MKKEVVRREWIVAFLFVIFFLVSCDNELFCFGFVAMQLLFCLTLTFGFKNLGTLLIESEIFIR